MAAPAIVFTYNRPDKTKRTLEALNSNTLAPETDLFIFNDNANPDKENDFEKVGEVRTLLYSFKENCRFRSVHIFAAEKHYGLAKSVINGVTMIMNQYGRVIVTEDDLISHVNYLEYMNDCLDYYENEKRIWSISGYTYELPSNAGTDDVYFTYRGSSWGWATWKDRWDTVDWSMKDYGYSLLLDPRRINNVNRAGRDLLFMLRNQKKHIIDSWAVRWVFEQTKENLLTVYPARTFLHNEGLDGSGTHGVNEGNDLFADLNAVSYRLTPIRYNYKQLNEFAENYEDPFFGSVQKFKENGSL